MTRIVSAIEARDSETAGDASQGAYLKSLRDPS